MDPIAVRNTIARVRLGADLSTTPAVAEVEHVLRVVMAALDVALDLSDNERSARGVDVWTLITAAAEALQGEEEAS